METDTSTEVTELQARVAQLQTALVTRIVVEQSKGILAERFKLSVDDSFLLLRYAARSSRTNIRELAHEIVVRGTTPRSVTVAMARQQRWRAPGHCERSEAHREKATQERERAAPIAANIRKGGPRPA
ncbi:MAG TPA: ANTAR domain-containing protein [Gaiellaceae bacterium]